MANLVSDVVLPLRRYRTLQELLFDTIFYETIFKRMLLSEPPASLMTFPERVSYI